MANKLSEITKTIMAVKPDSYAAGTYYNGAADTSAVGLDVRGYNEVLVVLTNGDTQTVGTNTVTIVGTNSSTVSGSECSAISGAAFTVVTSANDNAVQIANLNVPYDYLAVKSVVATSASEFGCIIIASEPDSKPAADIASVVFNV